MKTIFFGLLISTTIFASVDRVTSLDVVLDQLPVQKASIELVAKKENCEYRYSEYLILETQGLNSTINEWGVKSLKFPTGVQYSRADNAQLSLGAPNYRQCQQQQFPSQNSRQLNLEGTNLFIITDFEDFEKIPSAFTTVSRKEILKSLRPASAYIYVYGGSAWSIMEKAPKTNSGTVLNENVVCIKTVQNSFSVTVENAICVLAVDGTILAR